MEIVKTKTILKLPETLEKGAEKMCDKPYYIERIEEGNYVTWYGYNTNWQRHNNMWTELVDGGFVFCEEPEYEKLYQKALK